MLGPCCLATLRPENPQRRALAVAATSGSGGAAGAAQGLGEEPRRHVGLSLLIVDMYRCIYIYIYGYVGVYSHIYIYMYMGLYIYVYG